MDNWDEIRTAFQVARLGTVSGAAEVLGVHHATVIRHIDALEQRLGVKLFQRHSRGYTPTEAGEDLLRVAQATDDQFAQLASRVKGRGEAISGELVVTTLSDLAPQLVTAAVRFQADHPEIILRYLTSDRLFRLEYGEAHVAIRAGNAPDNPDNVVQPFMSARAGLFAARSYIERHGLPEGPGDFAGHRFVGSDDSGSRAPFMTWLGSVVPREAVVFRALSSHVMAQAVRAGAGIGFLPLHLGRADPDLVEVCDPLDDWSSPLWLVTHVDLHRTPKVQAFLAFLKDSAAEWGAA